MARKLKPIEIVFRNTEDCYGKAFAEDRIIWLDPRSRRDMFFKTALHEPLHVELPDIDEEAVLRTSRSQHDVLKRLGYRRCTCGKCACIPEED